MPRENFGPWKGSTRGVGRHVNQAAINYHFKTKDGLYREVLRDAVHALAEDQLSHAQETQAMPRERALGEFVRQQLRPLSARDFVTRTASL